MYVCYGFVIQLVQQWQVVDVWGGSSSPAVHRPLHLGSSSSALSSIDRPSKKIKELGKEGLPSLPVVAEGRLLSLRRVLCRFGAALSSTASGHVLLLRRY
jgi:hypothetical protein